MDTKRLYLQSEIYNKKHDYDLSLALLRNAAHEILTDDKILLKNKEVESFLGFVESVETEAADYTRIGMTNSQSAIAEEINKICLQIIRKYNILDLHLRISFIRAVIAEEKDPEKLKELEKEWDVLLVKKMALERNKV